jgi:hypothetical protein
MHRSSLLLLAVLAVSCISVGALHPGRWSVAYYDRNGDGIVDYELHTLGSGHADADWALIDTKFQGRYDLRVHWGYVLEKRRVDLPVSKGVKITPGQPLKSYNF